MLILSRDGSGDWTEPGERLRFGLGDVDIADEAVWTFVFLSELMERLRAVEAKEATKGCDPSSGTLLLLRLGGRFVEVLDMARREF